MWTLLYNGTEKTFAEWGLANLKRTLLSQKADEVTFEQTGAAYDGTSLFSYGDTVTIRRAGVNWFVGRVLKVPRAGRGQDENLSYTLAGPWWYLDDLVFQQYWTVNDLILGTIQKLKGRVILGQDANGNAMTSGQVLNEILDFAIAAGRPFQKGTIDPSVNLPLDENKDITCGDAMRKILRWHPDTVTWFDYSTAPYPTLHIRRAANLSAVSLPLDAGNRISSFEITPRNDLQRPSVLLRYEQSGSTNGTPWVNIVDDIYPPGATGQEVGALHMTIPLHGADVRTSYQKIQVRQILDSSGNPNDDATGNILAYWQSVLGIGTNSQVTNLTFEQIPGTSVYFQRALTNPTATDLNGNPIALNATLPNELLQGSVTDWMQTEQGLTAQQQTISCCLSYTYNGQHFTNQPFSYSLTATDAQTRTYSKESYKDGEPVPVGLAQNYYLSLQTLACEGTITFSEIEVSGTVEMGQVVNFTGGVAAWNTVNALVQQVMEEIDRGISTVHFGPAKHLNPQELITLGRILYPSYSGRVGDGANGRDASRHTNKPADSTGLSYAHPHANSFALPKSPPAPVAPFSLIDVSDSTGTQVKVNLFSSLFSEPDQTSRISITGLDTPIDVSAGTIVILQITVMNLISTSATITTATTAPAQFVFTGANNDVLTQVNLILGYVEEAGYSQNASTTISGGNPAVSLALVQCVSTHLLMQSGAYGPGYGVIYPVPFCGPYIAS